MQNTQPADMRLKRKACINEFQRRRITNSVWHRITVIDGDIRPAARPGLKQPFLFQLVKRIPQGVPGDTHVFR